MCSEERPYKPAGLPIAAYRRTGRPPKKITTRNQTDTLKCVHRSQTKDVAVGLKGLAPLLVPFHWETERERERERERQTARGGPDDCSAATEVCLIFLVSLDPWFLELLAVCAQQEKPLIISSRRLMKNQPRTGPSSNECSAPTASKQNGTPQCTYMTE